MRVKCRLLLPVIWCALCVSCFIIDAFAADFIDNRPPELTTLTTNVDTQSGNAVQSLSIEIPPGINSIQPAIALTYNSSRSAGISGIGWSLELGGIERSTRLGAPQYNASDSYDLILGAGRQILVSDTNAGFYRCEIEGAFMRTVFDSNGNYWLVTDKQGTKYYFGSTVDSRQCDPNNAGRVFRWSLNRVEDINGNYLTISYAQDNGQLYPDIIAYTGNSNTNLAPFAKVEFIFAQRAKNHRTFLPGFRVLTQKRIAKIIVRADGAVQREYDFIYTQSRNTQRDLLSAVRRLGSDSTTALPDITFSYYDNEKGFAQDTAANIPQGAMFSQAASGLQPYQDLGSRIADINNDGFPDLIKDYATVNSSNQVTAHSKVVYLNNKNNGWVQDNNYTLPGNFTSNPQDGITFIKEVSGSSGKIYPDYSLMIADINGDGKNEVVHSHLYYNIDGSNIATGYNKKAYFYGSNGWEDRAAQGWGMPTNTQFMIWLTQNYSGSFSYRLEALGNYLCDVNGDGSIDIVTSRKPKQTANFNDATENYKKVFLSQQPSNGWENGPNETWTRPDNGYTDLSNGAELVDLNGDGRPDIFYCKAGTAKVFMNTGYNWVEDTGSPWLNTFGLGDLKDGSTQMADINGDGLADMIIAKGGYDSGSRVLINTGDGWIQDNAWVLPEGIFLNLGTRLLDANADSVTDFMVHFNGQPPKLYVNQGKPADLLKTVDNGAGGLISLEYGSSAQFTQAFMPFAIPVIRSITKSNKLGNTCVTRYDYTQGLWQPNQYQSVNGSLILTGHREFRGFGKVRITDNEGNYSEAAYNQDYYTKGRVKEIDYFDRSGKILRKESMNWGQQDITNGAKFVFLSSRGIYAYNNDQNSDSWSIAYTYGENPQFGDVTKITELFSDRTTEFSYYYNTDKWLIGFPKEAALKDSNGTVFRKSWFYYDGNNDTQNTAPVKGLLTKKEQWAGTDQPGDDPETLFEYNALGLPVKTIEPVQAALPPASRKSTTISYDSKYGIFPVLVTNPLGHTARASYYGVAGEPLSDQNGFKGLWGQVKAAEDANAQKTQMVYDVFGRPVKTIGPLDSMDRPSSITEYTLTSTYTKITSRQRVKHGENATVDSFSFIDGLGVPLQVKTPSSVSGKFVVSGQAVFNSKNAAIESYQPFFSTNSLDTLEPLDPARGHTGYEYDGLSRVTKTVNPDNSFSSVVYDKLAVEVIDENGHKHRAEFDTDGRLFQRIEYTGADGRFAPVYPNTNGYSAYTAAQYDYNPAGDLIQTTDYHGNKTTIAYDKLGRKTTMTDPDMGTWQYNYDPNGNLVKQVDAQNNQIQFSFDELNRPIARTYQAGSPVSYTYDDAGVNYAIGRLTAAQYGGNTQYRYDALGNLTKVLQAAGSSTYTTQQTYDALNRMDSVVYPNGIKVNYAYNPAGQLQKVTLDRTQAQNPPAVNIPAQAALYVPVSGDKQVSLSWNSVSGAIGYRVYYGTTGNNLSSSKDAGNNTAFIVTGLANNTVYYFSLAAYNEAGEGARADVKSAAPQLPPPAKPQNVQASPGVGSVTLTWDAVAAASEYKTDYGTSSSNLSQSITGIPQTNYNITGLSYDTQYFFKVTAKNASGFGPGSEIVSARTTHPPAPAVPVLNNPVAGDSQVSLSWNSVSGASGYKLEFKTSSGSTWSEAYNGVNISYTRTGLANGTSYDFRVSAYNQWESSVPSAVKSAVPQPQAPVEIKLDVASNITGSSKSQLSLQHTVTNLGANRALIVTISLSDFMNAPQTSSVTYAGQALTLIDRQAKAGTYKSVVEMWYLLNPAPGINTIQAQFNVSTANIAMGAVSLTGVKQQAPEAVSKSSGSSTPASVSLTTTTSGAWVIDTLYYNVFNSWVTMSSGQTQLYKQSLSNSTHASSYKSKLPAGTTSMQWTCSYTSFDWALMAAAFAPASSQTACLATPSQTRVPIAKARSTSSIVIARPIGRSNLKHLLARLKNFIIPEAYAATPFDYTTFTENDSNNQVGVAANIVTFTNAETKGGRAYLYKACQTQGDFTFEFDSRITKYTLGNDDTALWGITNKAAATTYNWTDGVFAGVSYGTSTSNMKLCIKVSGQSSVKSSTLLSLNTRYYFRVKRQGSTITAEVYSNSARTTLVTSVSTAFNANVYSYLYAFSVGGSTSTIITGYKVSGDVSNLIDGAIQAPLPQTPVLNSITAGQGMVSVNWSASNFASTYTVHYGTVSGNYTLKKEGIASTSVTISYLENDTPYYFAVSAQNSTGSSGYSNEKSAIPRYTPPTSAPANVSATAGVGQVNLSWGAVTDVTGYKIRYGTVSGTYPNEIDAGKVTQKTVTGLNYNTKYYFVVLGYNPGGNGPVSAEVSATTQNPPPPSKPVLNDPVAGNAKATLSWSAVSMAQGYKLRYRLDSQSYMDNWVDAGNVTQYDVTGLTNGKTYYFQLLAYNAGGNSDVSDEKRVTLPVLPGKPVLNQPQAGNKKVFLSWPAVTDAAGYKVAYKPVGGSYGSFIDIGNVTFYEVDNLANGTKYYFKVAAYNAVGSGPESDPVSAVPQAPPAVSEIISNIEYNAAGQKEKVYYSNGNIVQYEYDANLRLARMHTVRADGGAIQDLSYTYDGVGNILSITDNVHTSTQYFTYDSTGRLIQAQGQYGQESSKPYVYDPIGNLTQNDGVSYSYGDGVSAGVHAVTAAGGQSFSYDANGNLIKKVENSAQTDYLYDAENRLKSVEQPNSTMGRYEYDDEGQRTAKVVNSNVTVFVGDLYERKGNAVTVYIYMDGERIASLMNDEIEYSYSDHLGGANVTANDAGAVTDVAEYEPFGEFSRHDAPAKAEGRFYTGQYRDSESGLYYYGGRYYNPKLARFMTADPYVSEPFDPQGLNRFAYVGNNPVNYIDPSGFAGERRVEVTGWNSEGSNLVEDPPYNNSEDEMLDSVHFDGGPMYHWNENNGSVLADALYDNKSPELSSWAPQSPTSICRSAVFSPAITILPYFPLGIGDEQYVIYSSAPVNLTRWQELSRQLGIPEGDEKMMQYAEQMAIGMSGGIEFVGTKATVMHLHHLLPKQFKKIFQNAGLNIEKFKKWIPIENHILKPSGIHTGSRSYNKIWTEFFEKFKGSAPTKNQIIDQLKKMMRDFKM